MEIFIIKLEINNNYRKIEQYKIDELMNKRLSLKYKAKQLFKQLERVEKIEKINEREVNKISKK